MPMVPLHATIPKYFATFNEHVSRRFPESASLEYAWSVAPVLFSRNLRKNGPR